MYQLIQAYSTDPWKNLFRGLSVDSRLGDLASGIVILCLVIAIIGVTVNILIAAYGLILSPKRRNESKMTILKKCGIAIAICCFPAVISMIYAGIKMLLLS